ncbi:unnamed protein product, partial [Prorocentrum cordatum]
QRDDHDAQRGGRTRSDALPGGAALGARGGGRVPREGHGGGRGRRLPLHAAGGALHVRAHAEQALGARRGAHRQAGVHRPRAVEARPGAPADGLPRGRIRRDGGVGPAPTPPILLFLIPLSPASCSSS